MLTPSLMICNKRDSVPSDKQICHEYIQKIEKRMGRGVCFNNDYCVIIFMGDKLADIKVNQGGGQLFNKAALEQYNLSRQLWIQLMESGAKLTIEEVFSLLNYPVIRDTEWITAGKGVLASVKLKYDKINNIYNIVAAMCTFTNPVREMGIHMVEGQNAE
ncbi:hypothetical protein [Lacrimispora sp.]|uniref:hypothetical protein n=1 Tax=Lacrimispora sp. TaxID=2719234 RepID=UPI0039E3B601